MRSYLWKQNVTNRTSTSICDFCIGITHLSKFFAFYQRYGTTSARNIQSERYKKGKQVKNRESTVSFLLLFPSASLPTFFLPYFHGTTNSLQQATATSSAFTLIYDLWLSSIMTGQCQLSFSERVLLFFKVAFSDWLAAKRFLYTKRYSLYIQISCQYRIASKETRR